MLTNGPNAPRVSMTRRVAVYETTTGRVVHIHHVVIVEGAQAVGGQQPERRVHNAGKKTFPAHDHAARVTFASVIPERRPTR